MENSLLVTKPAEKDTGKDFGDTVTGLASPYLFQLPSELEAHEPPEARGLGRDGVRLMVSYRSAARTVHTRFRDLPLFLQPGDVLAINTSKTINAAVNSQREDGTPIELHFSTQLSAREWIVELRKPALPASEPFFSARAGESLSLPGSGRVRLIAPYQAGELVRLWTAEVKTDLPVQAYLERFGFPIRYKHVEREWPLSYYQTVYASEPGSAEMPSAGRAFTRPILRRLQARGVPIAPLLLHTGVASLENHEPPPPEWYCVPAETAQAVNQAHQSGRNVIAVGTTVIRALETVTGTDGIAHPGAGWTDLLVTPERGIFGVDGLLTGFHEPRSTHLWMIEALAGQEHIQQTYAEAIQGRYLWHEFGDLHLLLP